MKPIKPQGDNHSDLIMYVMDARRGLACKWASYPGMGEPDKHFSVIKWRDTKYGER